MAHTRNWNAAYEATPPNTQGASQGADRVRELKLDIRERLDLDHIMDEDVDDDGRHRTVHLVEQASDPGNLADKLILYSKEVATITELFARDSAGNLFQITEAGDFKLLSNNNAFTAGQATTEVDVTFATSLTIDAALSNAFRVTLTNNFTLNLMSNLISGQVVTVRFIQDGTGSRVLTFGSGYFGNTSDDLVLSTGVNDQDLMTFYRDSAGPHVLSLKKDIGNAL